MIDFEVCCGDIESVVAADEGGAVRIELCSALGEGGITPFVGLIQEALAIISRVNVLIRPRGGDFVYSLAEKRTILRDIELAARLGANAVVCGSLNPDGSVDRDFLKDMLSAAGDMDFTFHRAFDLCDDAHKAFDCLAEEGCSSLLTSGMAATAVDGIPLLRQLVEWSAGDLEIIAAGGITPLNVRKVVTSTGVTAVHGSCSSMKESRMIFRRVGVSMGSDSEEYKLRCTDSELVDAVLDILAGIN